MIINNDDLLDSLLDTPNDPNDPSSGEIVLPKRCSTCITANVCSVLGTFIALGKINIYVGVEKCQYYNPIKKS